MEDEGAQRCIKIGRQTLRADNVVLRGDSRPRRREARRDQEPHDGLTDVEIMGCADADGRRDRWPVIGDGNAVRTCVHAFPRMNIRDEANDDRPMTIGQ